ncbi:hypothetical protein N2384_01670 [Bacillus paralicheniformis]|uniref:hypothetical protein n=1 Tax=Bacillus paralicheniformis TaxID=1648923 RepID=UPI0021A25C85|nr:hypothetical protein [Bacillus paralicheniformis]UWS61960.1 hypothetical protein N2384_01670 [Bacillus paralicheniformis]
MELFQRTGLHLSFKHGLAKLLWLQDRDPAMLRDAVWLSNRLDDGKRRPVD